MNRTFFNKRERILVLTAMGAVLFAFLKLWYLKERVEVSALEQTQQQLSSRQRTAREIIGQARARAPAASDTVVSASDLLSADKNIAQLLESIGGVPQQFGLRINRIASEGEAIIEGIKAVSFKIDVEASFLAVGQFIDFLEELKYLIHVDSVEVLRITDDLKRCTAQIHLASFTKE